jgi:hypothetical protein
MKKVITHPPYSPNLASCEFFLFLKMELKLKGLHFDRIEEIQTKPNDMIKTPKQNDL